jgi:polyketide synthase PksN
MKKNNTQNSIEHQISIIANNRHSINRELIRNQFAPVIAAKPIPSISRELQHFYSLLEILQIETLWQQLREMGFELTPDSWRITTTTLPRYHAWFEESARLLRAAGYPARDKGGSLAALWSRWQALPANAEATANAALVQATLSQLPSILTGKIPATDVLFPKSSMDAISGSYKGNAQADYFNQVVADIMVAIVNALDREGAATLRILEVGAGTGGTSAMVFEALAPYRELIKQYTYTDISKAFLIHAEESYGKANPYLDYQLFNVEQVVETQGIALGHYDVVIATNVLHATRNIHSTLRNVKATLKPGGVLLMNEINSNSVYSHLTFGLTEGWWLAEDDHLRIPGCPGLSEEQWEIVLQDEGFEAIEWPADKVRLLGQQIILASANPIIRQSRAPVKQVKPVEHVEQRKSTVSTNPRQPYTSISTLQGKTEALIKNLVAHTLRLGLGEIENERPLSDYGMDSILVVQVADALSKIIEGVSSTLLFEYPSVSALSDHFVNRYPEILTAYFGDAGQEAAPSSTPAPVHKSPVYEQPVLATRRARRSSVSEPIAPSTQPDPQVLAQPVHHDIPIAIIGVAGRYPQSPTLEAYWNNLKNGTHCIEEIPSARWDWRDFYSEEKGQPGKIYTRWGGFISHADCFDPLFFHISPKEAQNMDPQERVFLETAYAVIEDAGYTPATLTDNQKVGVFVGVMNSTYSGLTSYWSIANRVSYCLDFRGPSLAVDTACSSSLTAIHVAVESLKSGSSELAIAGGVNLILRPIHYMGLSMMRMLTPGSECKSFGAGADGFVDGEGVGALLLKPLDRAQLDNDHCYAVIRGSAVNAGGRTQGYSVPNPGAQSQVIVDALTSCRIDPRTISYVEAHGTGTELGDPIEITGLSRAFATQSKSDDLGYCALGSVKSNIGHLESAAGIAGVTKILLQMKYRQLVPSLHSLELNPKIDFGRTPFVVQRELTDWKKPILTIEGETREYPRIAGISSFGAGGSNAHVILEEYEASSVASAAIRRPLLLVLSAKTAEQLIEKAKHLLAFVQTHSLNDDDLVHLVYTLQVGREAMEERAATTVDTVASLKSKLNQCVMGEPNRTEKLDWMFGSAKKNKESKSAFSDDELSEAIEKWSAGEKYQKLIELWVNGFSFDWQRLYQNGGIPRRMSLPTYPFARERYWNQISQVTPSAPLVIQSAVPSIANHHFLHPLLHENTSTSFDTQFTSHFTGEEFFFTDHQIQGQKVFPGSGYLEMARVAITKALALEPHQPLKLSDVVWRRPLVIAYEQTLTVHISINLINEQTAAFDIYSISDAGEEVIYSQGRGEVLVATEIPQTNLSAVQRVCSAQYHTAENVYALFEQMGFSYGPEHRGIVAFYTGIGSDKRQQVLAELILRPGFETHAYGLHPGLLDSILQSTLGMSLLVSDSSGSRSQGASLPFALGSLTMYQPLPSAVYAWVRYSEGSSLSDATQSLDIQVCDEKGQVCVELMNYTSRILKEPLASETTSPLLYYPNWEVAEASMSSEALATHHIWLIGGFTQDNHASLQAALPKETKCELLDVANSGLAECYHQTAEKLFIKLKAHLLEPGRTAARVQVVIQSGHSASQQCLVGISSMLKTAYRENPKVVLQCIDLTTRIESLTLAALLLTDARDHLSQEIRYESGAGGKPQRQVKRWREVSLETIKAANQTVALPAWRNGGVYLITGGLGSLGLIVATATAERCVGAKVILTGRSVLTNKGQEQLESMKAQGLDVSYQVVNVSNRFEVENLMVNIKTTYGRLTGIIHSAGVIEDNFIVKKSVEEFARVLAPKVSGLVNLDEASREFELEFFACFSSLAGEYGNPGQVDYAAANGFMDQYTRYRNQQVERGACSGRTVSINWPLWADGGMQVDSATLSRMKQMGQNPLSTDEGLSVYANCLNLGLGQVLVIAGKGSAIRAQMARNNQEAEVSSVSAMPLKVKEIDVSALQRSALNYFKQQLAQALELSLDRLDVDAALENYGMDSVLAMDLTDHLEQHFGPLSKTLFFEVQTVRALNEYFIANHEVALHRILGIHQTHSLPLQVLSATSVVEKIDTSDLLEKSLNYFKQQLAQALELSLDRIDVDAALENYGMDSVLAMDLTDHLEQRFGPLSKTLFFEVQTVRGLTDYFIANHSEALQQLLGTKLYSTAPTRPTASDIKPLPSNLAIRRNRWRLQEPRGLSNAPVRELSNSTTIQELSVPDCNDQSIAIVGLSGRYPQAANVDVFWDNLQKGRDCITEIPADRWDYREYFDPDRTVLGKSYSKWGGFIDGADRFDPLFFNISPRDADFIDPQERLFLQCVYNTLEDAGYTREGLAQKRPSAGTSLSGNVGVFVGVMYEEYQLYSAQAQTIGWNVGISGNPSSIANRVSYWFNFRGPSLAVDTMCSSSLMAIHLAVHHIQKGSCDAAIAGGTNLSIHPNKYFVLSQGKFVSSDGKCASFGEGGDGYVPGEGVGAVLLKPTRQAAADGDHIYAVIKGTAVNHGGKTNGYTVPNPIAQAEVISLALQDAQVDPRTISYIEAHGTGTPLGDPIEISGLSKAFAKYGPLDSMGVCAIGSVKSNIGHCESASGIAGITKILLQMKYRQLVPSIHSERLNPNIDFAKTPFMVQRELSPWNKPRVTIDGETREYPRIAGISSFGAGGSNAHIILQEYEATTTIQALAVSGHPLLLVLSAKTEEQLIEQARNLLVYVEMQSLGNSDLLNLCYTLQIGREAMEERAAIIVDSIEALKDKLAQLANASLQKSELAGWKRASVKNNKVILSEFAADEDAQTLVSTWLAKGKYDKFLDLWVKGWSFDWRRLYENEQQPQRISLPTYPFKTERYWIDLPKISPAIFAVANHQLHPLLHENTSTGFDTRFTSRFTGTEFFFADHQVAGQKVLPGAAHLEMARVAITKALILGVDDSLELNDVIWLCPVVLTEECAPLTLHISITPRSETSAEYDIYSLDSDGKEIIHSRGRGEVLEVARDNESLMLDLTSVRQSMGAHLSADVVYDLFAQSGFTYGPGHRGIIALHTQTEIDQSVQALGELVLPESVKHGAEAYWLHPGLLDSALQSTLGLSFVSESFVPSSSPSVPFALGAIRMYRPIPSTAFAWVGYSEGSQPGDSVQKLNIRVCDEQGRVCVDLEQFCVRAQSGESKEVSVSRTSSAEGAMLQMLLPVWELASEALIQPKENRFNNTVIVSCDGSTMDAHFDGVVEGLVAALPDAKRLSLSNCNSVEKFRTLLQEGATEIDHLVWILPRDTTESVTSDDLISAQTNGVLGGLHLIQTLLTLGYIDRELRLSVISWQTQAVSQIPHYPAHASVHGFIGSVAKECSRWSVRVLDIPLTADAAFLVESLKLTGNASGEVLAYRKGHWYQQQLILTKLPELPEETAYKHRGVYVVIGGAGGLGEVWSEVLVRDYQAQIVWIGRRAIDETIGGKIERLAKLGPAPLYLQADATDRVSLEQARQTIHQHFGKVHGVVHSAIVLRDKSVRNMDISDFSLSLQAKVDTSVRMVQVFADEPLDFIMFFSSVQSFAKGAGQCNYAAGCVFEDLFGLRLAETLPCAVKIMNWGYWGSVGVAADQSYRERMSVMGIGSIEPEEGMLMLRHLMASPYNQLSVIKQNLVARAPTLTPTRSLNQKVSSTKLSESNLEEKPIGVAKTNSLIEKTHQYFSDTLSQFLKINPEVINIDEPISNYGVDSIVGLDITTELEKSFGTLSKTLLFEYQTIKEISEYFFEKHSGDLEKILQEPISEFAIPLKIRSPKITKGRLREKNDNIQKNLSTKIAVIGLAGRYPQAANLQEFWENLKEGKDCITEVPNTRWNHKLYYSADKNEIGKSTCNWGGFLDDIDEFDSLLFNISPFDASLMSPKDRLFMETVWSLFESAGINRQKISGFYERQVGLYVGAMYMDMPADVSKSLEESSMALLNSYNSIANRTSHFFGLQGPSIAIDTACSSSLNCIHMACKDLLSGECRLAVAGGVNIHSNPMKYVNLSAIGLLSSDIERRAFCGGDGYLPAEAVGAVLLKSLDDALADGDNVLAVILSSASNHNGSATSYMVPNVNSQAQLIERNISKAGIEPSSISYIETSATGGMLGDAIEISALNKVFGKIFSNEESCPIGNVKSNIGHAEAASGMSQLTKVILQLQHKMLVPNIQTVTKNPNINLAGSSFYLQQDLAEWKVPKQKAFGIFNTIPRRALVNSFGATGSNASILIEEFEDLEHHKDSIQNLNHREHVIILSARTRNALRKLGRSLADYLNKNENVSLNALAYTLQIGREVLPERLAVLASNQSELKNSLNTWDAQFEQKLIEKKSKKVYEANAEEESELYLILAGGSEAISNKLLLEQQFDKIALLWVKGCPIQWDLLHNERQKILTDLPSYPFERRTKDNINASNDKHIIQDNHLLNGLLDRSERDEQLSVITLLEEYITLALDLPSKTIKHNKPLMQYGVNSISGSRLIRYINENFNINLSIKEFFENDSLLALSQLVESYIQKNVGDIETKEINQIIVNAKSIDKKERLNSIIENEFIDNSAILSLEKFKNGEINLDDIKKMLEGEF